MEKKIWYKNVETGERIECTIAPVVVVNRDKIGVESKKPTAPGIPRRSPIQVLTGLDVA